MEQRTPEWLEFRKSMIGGSDAPVIMNVSPWKTPYQLWQEKLDLIKDDQENKQMLRGIELESEALVKFEQLTGYLMAPKVIIHPLINWMMASLDGIELEGKAAVEIKCPGKIDHECALDGQVPEKYIPQLQHQMEVCALEKIYYFSYAVTSWKILEVYKDESYVNDLLKKEEEFYELCQRKEPPPISERDFIEIDSMEWEMLSNRWKTLSEQMNAIEKEQEEIKENFIRIASNKNAKGKGITLTKVCRKGAIDYTAIPELKKIDVERYRKAPTEAWRLIYK